MRLGAPAWGPQRCERKAPVGLGCCTAAQVFSNSREPEFEFTPASHLLLFELSLPVN
jgi:hypothetical protein